MRPSDSAYDRACSEFRWEDPGAGEFAIISDHNGPCSLVADFASLDAAIEAARTMDTSEAPTDLEDEIGYDGSGDADADGLIEAAEEDGWSVIAWAGAGEYWTVLANR